MLESISYQIIKPLQPELSKAKGHVKERELLLAKAKGQKQGDILGILELLFIRPALLGGPDPGNHRCKN